MTDNNEMVVRDYCNNENDSTSTTPRSRTSLPSMPSSSPNSNTNSRKYMYLGILLFTLITVCLSTNDTSMLIQVLFQYHEPSIRIFRGLAEMILLLLCTAVSIRVYVHYISLSVVHSLLFQSIYSRNGNNDEDDNDDDREQNRERNDDQALFQPVNDNEDDDDDDGTDRHGNQKDNDDNSNLVKLGSAATDADLATTTSLHQLSVSILSMALDLSLYTCITLILYLLSAIHALQQPPLSSESSFSSSSPESSPAATTTTNSDRTMAIWMAKIAAPTFPLLLFLFCGVRCLQSYHQYKQFYTILSYTTYAPFYNVTFRDGMIGDIFTSMVRPMQDIAFTMCYILFGLRGYWSDHQHDYYGYMQHASATNTNAASLSIPTFLSTGSNITASFSNDWVQSADAYVPSMERSWIVHTAILPACMISPLWWRFLQTIRQSYEYEQRWPYLGNSMKYFFAAQVAMLGVYHPSLRQSSVWICSFILATLYQIYWDVFMDWGLLVHNQKTSMWNLRPQRLYPWKSFYWMLLVVNTILRFCWTLSFVPFNYLSAAGVLTNNFSSEAWANILVPTIASAEIVRRTLWGFVRVEWEAIKTQNEMSSDSIDNGGAVEMTPMKVIDATESWGQGTHGITNRYKLPFTSDMSSMNKIQIFGELCLYTTTFAVLGLIIAAHRGTM